MKAKIMKDKLAILAITGVLAVTLTACEGYYPYDYRYGSYSPYGQQYDYKGGPASEYRSAALGARAAVTAWQENLGG